MLSIKGLFTGADFVVSAATHPDDFCNTHTAGLQPKVVEFTLNADIILYGELCHITRCLVLIKYLDVFSSTASFSPEAPTARTGIPLAEGGVVHPATLCREDHSPTRINTQITVDIRLGCLGQISHLLFGGIAFAVMFAFN